MQIVVDCPARNATPNCNLRHLHFVLFRRIFQLRKFRAKRRKKLNGILDSAKKFGHSQALHYFAAKPSLIISKYNCIT